MQGPQAYSSIKFKQSEIMYLKNPQSPYQNDIIANKYEGGYKIWECTLDMLKYLAEVDAVAGRRVLQIGCGHGILGMVCLKAGAQFCLFQDYNLEVIENANFGHHISNKFGTVSGDWDTIGKELKQQDKFDIIIGSEIIYNPDNYIKIINLIRRTLKADGKAILINKCYYFGVGGNLDDFKQALQQNGMQYTVQLKICPSKGGNKKQIISVTSSKQ